MFQRSLSHFHDGIFYIDCESRDINYANISLFSILAKDIEFESKQEETNFIMDRLAEAKCKPNLRKSISVYEESALSYLERINSSSDTERLHTDEFQLEVDGETKSLKLYCSKIIIDESQSLQMVTVKDMTPIYQLQMEKNINQAKTIAFSQAAHEFRNPLNGVLSSVEVLEGQLP